MSWQRGSAYDLDYDRAADWRDRAACRDVDPELFWPLDNTPGAVALHICRHHCPVREECDEWASARRWPGAVIGGRRWVMAKGKAQESTTARPDAAGCPICREGSRG